VSFLEEPEDAIITSEGIRLNLNVMDAEELVFLSGGHGRLHTGSMVVLGTVFVTRCQAKMIRL
jgi:hypothetical protein